MDADGRPLDRLPTILVATPYYDTPRDIFTSTEENIYAGNGQYFEAQKFRISTSAVDMARNSAVEVALEQHFDYVMFADADMAFPAGTLIRLLAAMETAADEKVYITSGVYCYRRDTYVYAVYNRSGLGFASVSDLPDAEFKLDEGIYKADAAGTGCMLIRTDLFTDHPELAYPWFQYWYKPKDEGGKALRWSEDLVFGYKCSDIGVHVFVNTKLVCKHELRNCSVYPIPDKGGFEIEIDNKRWSMSK